MAYLLIFSDTLGRQVRFFRWLIACNFKKSRWKCGKDTSLEQIVHSLVVSLFHTFYRLKSWLQVYLREKNHLRKEEIVPSHQKLVNSQFKLYRFSTITLKKIINELYFANWWLNNSKEKQALKNTTRTHSDIFAIKFSRLNLSKLSSPSYKFSITHVFSCTRPFVFTHSKN